MQTERVRLHADPCARTWLQATATASWIQSRLCESYSHLPVKFGAGNAKNGWPELIRALLMICGENTLEETAPCIL